MRLKKFIFTLLIISYFIIFSGCSRVIDWGRTTFNQGCNVVNCLGNARDFIRNIRVYDQFNTLGIFSAMPLHEPVIEAYVDVYSKQFMLCPQEADNLFESEYSKFNDGLISFYVLAFVPHQHISPLFVPDKFEDAPWNVVMRTNCKIIEPCNIKIVDLNQEYQYIFCKYYSNFKIAYLVQFSDKDECGNCLIHDVNDIELIFSSIGTKVSLCWKALTI